MSARIAAHRRPGAVSRPAARPVSRAVPAADYSWNHPAIRAIVRAQMGLDCDGQRVALDGAIRVVRGTRAVSSAIVERHLEAFSSSTALTALRVRELLRAAAPGAR